MNRDLGAWTSEQCALVLIDYQKEMFEAIRSETQADLVELHVRWLARAAKAFDVPIVLSTVGVEYGFNSPTLPSIVAELDGIEPIDRSSMNAFDDEAFREAVDSTGRKRLIIGGLHTEVCLAFATVEALKSGYEAQFVTDAVGGRSQAAHRTATERLSQAGAVANTTLAVVCELFRDWAGPYGEAAREVTGWYFVEAPKLRREVVGMAPREILRAQGQVTAQVPSRLEGNVCVITGTGHSMSRAPALAFARDGLSVGADEGKPRRNLGDTSSERRAA